MYESGSSYMSINSARSAISFAFGQDKKIGEHPLITRFMKGVAHLRPPRSKYSVTWDVDLLLNKIRNWGQNLDLKMLTYKTVALLAICTGQRVQALASIKIEDIVIQESIQIKLTSRLKTTSVNRSNPILNLPKYTETVLCPVTCLKLYLHQTKALRKEVNQLFVSFAKPHKSVTSQTISRWLVEVLKLAGIDTDVYSAHSFRHASCSKAAKNGVAVDSILKCVGWSKNSQVFANYYNRPVDNNFVFANSVLT